VVTVNRHPVTLRAGDVSGLELKQEAVAQGAALQTGFDLWIRRGHRYVPYYDQDVRTMCNGQEFLAITTDDHAWPLPAPPAEHMMTLSATTWSLVLPPRLWNDLSKHLFGNGGEHAAVLLARPAHSPHQPKLFGREPILATHNEDYIEGSIGYHSLTSAFIRNAALRARDQQLAYLAVHNHANPHHTEFSPIDRASHERGYPALQAITEQPIGALVLTQQTATGTLWLPNGTRHTLTELVVPTDPRIRLHPQPAGTPASNGCPVPTR